MAWVSTEAVRTQSRELVLGRSLSKFMRTLGINSTSGGARGEQTRLRNQMNRLFGCTVQLIYEDANSKRFISSLIADRGEFWWNERKPDEPVLWDSKIRLGEDRSGIMQHEGKGIPHPFRQHPLLGGCSEPSRRDKYRR